MSDPNTSSSVSPFYDLMTYEDPPHVIAKKDGSGHEGLLVELVSLVSGKAGFSYSLRVLNESFGHKDSGRWSGLTRKMAEYSADMAVGAMVMSHADDDEVKYTEPFQTTSVQLLLPRPLAEVSPGAALLFVPFTATSWVLLIFAFVLVSLGLFLVGRFSPHEWGRLDPARDVRKARNSFGLKNSFLFVISTLTWQGYREAPRSLSGRVLAVSWWVFTLFILLAYTANLAAFVSSRPQTEPALSFRNFEDILQDRIVKIGMIRHGDVDLTLRMSTENLPKQLYEYVNARRNWVGNLEEGLERMRSSGRDFALMLPATKAQYLAARNCDLVAFGHGLVPISYAFAFSASRLSEPVKRRINSAILQLRQSGELYNLEQKWYSLGSKGCPDTDGNSLPVRRGETPPRFKAMDPQDLAMPFLLLFLCGLVTVGVAALEIMHAMGHFKLQKDEEEAAAEPFNTRAGPSAVDDKAELEDEEHPLKESPEKEMEDGKPDFEEELEPEEKEKRKEMKLYDDAAIKSDDDGTKAPASDIEKESD